MPLLGYPAPVTIGGGYMGGGDPGNSGGGQLVNQMMAGQQNPLYAAPQALTGIPLSSLLDIAKKSQQSKTQTPPTPYDNQQASDPYSGTAFYPESAPGTNSQGQITAPSWLTKLFQSFGGNNSPSVSTADGG
jgi:hypothetical protein